MASRFLNGKAFGPVARPLGPIEKKLIWCGLSMEMVENVMAEIERADVGEFMHERPSEGPLTGKKVFLILLRLVSEKTDIHLHVLPEDEEVHFEMGHDIRMGLVVDLTEEMRSMRGTETISTGLPI